MLGEGREGVIGRLRGCASKIGCVEGVSRVCVFVLAFTPLYELCEMCRQFLLLFRRRQLDKRVEGSMVSVRSRGCV